MPLRVGEGSGVYTCFGFRIRFVRRTLKICLIHVFTILFITYFLTGACRAELVAAVTEASAAAITYVAATASTDAVVISEYAAAISEDAVAISGDAAAISEEAARQVRQQT